MKRQPQHVYTASFMHLYTLLLTRYILYTIYDGTHSFMPVTKVSNIPYNIYKLLYYASSLIP
jgi:hypothetical protein